MKRTLASGIVYNGKLYNKGDQPDLSASDEKGLDKLGVLAPKPESTPKPASSAKRAAKE